MTINIDYNPEQTLPNIFQTRTRLSPNKVAYKFYNDKQKQWYSLTWDEVLQSTAKWQASFQKAGLKPGDKVAIMLGNRPEWVIFDQAALSLGLVVVPIYANDRADNVGYILDSVNAKVLFIENYQQWQILVERYNRIASLIAVIVLQDFDATPNKDDPITQLNDWLGQDSCEYQVLPLDPHRLATIVYTSGTTGKPKGVMLTHANIVSNVVGNIKYAPAFPDDTFLSFLPLSHMLERTVGYYLPMMTGSTVVYVRSIPLLSEDLITIKPTVLISVPRIFERFYRRIYAQIADKSPITKKLFEYTVATGWQHFLYKQGRRTWNIDLILWIILKKLVADKITTKLGGKIRIAVCGGAELSLDLSKTFIGLGLNLIQGYGMTEASPVISVNRATTNIPESVGPPLPGINIKTNEQNELMIQGPGVMQGYWQNPKATRQIIDAEGWLHTGDQARIDENGYIHLIGRIKEIIVLANGEKISPADVEQAICMDPLFDQAVLIGDNHPFLATLLCLNNKLSQQSAESLGLDIENNDIYKNATFLEHVKNRVDQQITGFPGHVKIHRIAILETQLTVDNGMLTPTLKLKRNKIIEREKTTISAIYAD